MNLPHSLITKYQQSSAISSPPIHENITTTYTDKPSAFLIISYADISEHTHTWYRDYQLCSSMIIPPPHSSAGLGWMVLERVMYDQLSTTFWTRNSLASKSPIWRRPLYSLWLSFYYWILLDLFGAFDTVIHHILLSTDGCVWRCEVSKPLYLTTGVPPGSVHWPLLFSLFMSSLSSVIQKHGFSYSDDQTVPARNSAPLQDSLKTALGFVPHHDNRFGQSHPYHSMKKNL